MTGEAFPSRPSCNALAGCTSFEFHHDVPQGDFKAKKRGGSGSVAAMKHRKTGQNIARCYRWFRRCPFQQTLRLFKPASEQCIQIPSIFLLAAEAAGSGDIASWQTGSDTTGGGRVKGTSRRRASAALGIGASKPLLISNASPRLGGCDKVIHLLIGNKLEYGPNTVTRLLRYRPFLKARQLVGHDQEDGSPCSLISFFSGRLQLRS